MKVIIQSRYEEGKVIFEVQYNGLFTSDENLIHALIKIGLERESIDEISRVFSGNLTSKREFII